MSRILLLLSILGGVAFGQVMDIPISRALLDEIGDTSILAFNIADRNGLVRIDVEIRDDDAPAPDSDAIVEWCDRWHERLFDVASSVAIEKDPTSNPSCGLHFRFWPPGRHQELDVPVTAYVGPRRVLPPLDEALNEATPAGGHLEIRFTLRQLIIAPNEPVAGQMVIRNIGDSFVPIFRDHTGLISLRRIQGDIVDADHLTMLRMKGHVRWIAPGQTVEQRFRLDTDPLVEDRCLDLEPGRYHVQAPDLLAIHNIDVKCDPVPLTVRADSATHEEPRLRHVEAAGPNVLLLREHGRLQWCDASTGEVIREVHVPDLAEFRNLLPLVSKYGAVSIWRDIGDLSVVIVDLGGDTPSTRRIPTPDLNAGLAIPYALSPDGMDMALMVSNQAPRRLGEPARPGERARHIEFVRTRTGEPFGEPIEFIGSTIGPISPDGDRWYEMLESGNLRVESLNGDPWSREVELQAPTQWHATAGRHALYLIDRATLDTYAITDDGRRSPSLQTNGALVFRGDAAEGFALFSDGMPFDSRSGTSTVIDLRTGQRLHSSVGYSVLVDDPPRLLRFRLMDEGRWMQDDATVLDPRTGDVLGTVRFDP